MKRAAFTAALVLVLGSGVLAIAQPGDGEGPPDDPGAIGADASSFGQCVAEAAQAGIENPDQHCAELKPGGEGEGNGDNGGGEGERGEDTFAAQCADRDKEDGSFGECVAALASSFGQCVRSNSDAGVANPAAACAELRPGRGGDGNGGPPPGTPSGPPAGTPNGPPEGTPNGPPEGTPSGPPAGTPQGRPSG